MSLADLALFDGPRAVTLPFPGRPGKGRTVGDLLGPSIADDAGSLSSLSGRGHVRRLEQAMAAYLGAPHVLGVSSGTAALVVALLACRVGQGDEVIVPAYDWGAAAAAIRAIGARPRFADIDGSRLTIAPSSVEAAITHRTAAVVATHIFGQTADLDQLCTIARTHGIRVIEDCAQALGATHRGRQAGTIGDAGCYSFGPGKAITAGEGGLVAFTDGRVYERALRVSQHPRRQQAEGLPCNPFALNFRLHPLAAVLATSQITGLAALIEDRRAAAAEVGATLSAVPGLRPVPGVAGTTHAFHRYSPAYVADEWEGLSRPMAVRALMAEGVPICEGFVPVPLPVLLARGAGHRRLAASRCPVATSWCAAQGLGLALPRITEGTGPWLAQVREAIAKVARRAGELARWASRHDYPAGEEQRGHWREEIG